jgi:hypothetical protein
MLVDVHHIPSLEQRSNLSESGEDTAQPEIGLGEVPTDLL